MKQKPYMLIESRSSRSYVSKSSSKRNFERIGVERRCIYVDTEYKPSRIHISNHGIQLFVRLQNGDGQWFDYRCHEFHIIQRAHNVFYDVLTKQYLVPNRIQENTGHSKQVATTLVLAIGTTCVITLCKRYLLPSSLWSSFTK